MVNRSGWLFWFVAALFYAYEMVHRVAPNVLTAVLRHDLAVDENQLGLIAATYFYSYALFQLPAGLAVDRFNTKVVLLTAAASVALGSALFTLSNQLPLIYLSRVIIGAGSAFAFVGCLSISRIWMSQKTFPLVVGLTNLFGTLGALLGGHPLALSVNSYGWRPAFSVVTLVGVVIVVLTLMIIPTRERYNEKHQQHSILEGLFFVMGKPITWVIAFYGALIVAPIVAFAELWGVDFLSQAYNLDITWASSMTQCIFIGTAIGGPLIGYLATHFSDLRIMRFCSVAALILLMLFIYYPHSHFIGLYTVFILYGLFSANMLLCFNMVNQYSPPWASGAAIGLINMVIMIVGGVVQQLIGKLRDFITVQHSGLYNLTDYQIALSLLPCCLMIAIGLTLFLRPVQVENNT